MLVDGGNNDALWFVNLGTPNDLILALRNIVEMNSLFCPQFSERPVAQVVEHYLSTSQGPWLESSCLHIFFQFLCIFYQKVYKLS